MLVLGERVIVGLGNTLTVVIALLVQVLAVPVTVYMVVVIGVEATILPVLLLNVELGVQV